MQWTDNAIILSARRHGENSAVLRLLTRSHGVHAGVLRASTSKTNRGVAQPGNVISATWSARLSEQLGTVRPELLVPNASYFMQHNIKLTALLSACTILESALPERHPYERLYREMLHFMDELEHSDNWQQAYIELEMAILAETGFGLDLSECAATGTRENLIYVSPKSGRAVCAEAGAPYHEKMLELPKFLRPITSPLPPGGEGQGGGISPLEKARALRQNMPKAEQNLWYHLRAHRFEGYGFRRQYPIGKYIADFVCLDKMLIVELDGGQHSEQMEYDAKRTEYLKSQGYSVIRFWNNDVLENMEGVLLQLLEQLKGTPSLTLPRQRERGNMQEILAGMRLTGYFLESWLLSPHRRILPAVRGRLIEMMEKHEAHAAETASA